MSQEPPAAQEAGAAGADAGARAQGSVESAPDPAPPSAPRAAAEARSRSEARRPWTMLALLLALAAIALAALSSWQLRRGLAALESSGDETRVRLENAVAGVRSSADDIDERLASLGRAIEADREHTRDLADRLDALPDRINALEKRVEADTGSSDARTEWLRAEAEYYLGVANTELALGGRWETAISALELADDRLRALSDPSLTEVRRLVADELQALKSVRLPDIEGLALGLGRLAERVDQLPLRRAGPADRAKPASVDIAKPGLGRLWLAVKRAALSLVSVERTAQPVAPALSAEDGVLARRRLELELELARAAALEAEPEAFAASLHNALALLERDFDTDSAAVGGATELLTQLLDVDIAPPRPDIGESLKRLRLAGRKG